MCYNLQESIQQMRYPIGIQTFREIIEGNYRYVDKTAFVFEMRKISKYIFLSRPRRFGKSLLSSTIESYFAGEEELFKGLKAHDLKKDWTAHPVLHFDMSILKSLSSEVMVQTLFDKTAIYEQQYGIEPNRTSPGGALENLIRNCNLLTGQKVVLIIDEYDAPLLHAIDEPTKMEGLRSEIQQFYSPIKACDAYLEFVFITGISKFSQLSIFSELNNLMNISMMPEFSAICGISKEELQTQFRPDVERMAKTRGISFEEEFAELEANYDGYHFSERGEDIFNPFSLLNAFARKNIGSYWYESGTPTVLRKLSKMYPFDISSIDGQKVSSQRFNIPFSDMQSALPVLYQSGYLTIKDYDEEFQEYTLGYPNKEVRMGMIQSFAPAYLNQSFENDSFIRSFYKFFRDDDLDGALNLMRSFVAKIPYLLENPNERHYQTIFYLIFNMLGQFMQSEVMMATGRIDAVVKTKSSIYVIEMKYDKTPEEALYQIEKKDYTLPYRSDPRRLVKVGLNVNSEKRTFGSWITEVV